MRPRCRAGGGGRVAFDNEGGRERLSGVGEHHAGLPTAHILDLVIRFGNAGPGVGALAVLPEVIELIEGGVAGQAALDQEAADHRAGATDACPTVDVHATARLHGVVQAIEDLGHMHALRG
jgi:hypothetical protein